MRPAGGAQRSGLWARTGRQPGRGAGGAACWEVRYNRGGVIGFALEFAIQATGVRNTVYSTQVPYSVAEYRCSWRSGVTANNLVSHNVRDLCAGGTPASANQGEAPAAWFVDAAGVGPHLAGGAGSVDALDEAHRVLKDVQGIVRGIPSDGGALKFRSAMPSTRGAG